VCVSHGVCPLQSCLLDQRFVLDDSVTVQQLLKTKGQQLGLTGVTLITDSCMHT